MEHRPANGALVTHRNLGPQTVYRVLCDNPDASLLSVVVQYVYGPKTHMENGYPRWNASIDNLLPITYAAQLQLPVGV